MGAPGSKPRDNEMQLKQNQRNISRKNATGTRERERGTDGEKTRMNHVSESNETPQSNLLSSVRESVCDVRKKIICSLT